MLSLTASGAPAAPVSPAAQATPAGPAGPARCGFCLATAGGEATALLPRVLGDGLLGRGICQTCQARLDQTLDAPLSALARPAAVLAGGDGGPGGVGGEDQAAEALCRRAICAVAYQGACAWLGDGYLDDPRAAVLRRRVIGAEDPSTRAGRLWAASDAAGPLGLWAPEPSAHLSFCMSREGVGLVVVRLGGRVGAVVVVTTAIKTYPRRELGDFLRLDAGSAAAGPLVGELRRLAALQARPVAEVLQQLMVGLRAGPFA